MLEVEGLHAYYGLSHVLFDIALRVDAGEVVSLLGRNGAGKTTTLKSIMGVMPPRAGRVRFKGDDVTGRPPFELARRGLGYVPDDRRIFADLTVAENLEIAARPLSRAPVPPAPAGSERPIWTFERVYELFPALGVKASNKGGHLSGGEQKMLAIARALVGNPDLLLLDEPMEGLAPLLVRSLEERILQLKHTGLTVLLAEQNVRAALRLSDRVYVIDDGRIRYQGTVADFRANDDVRRQYLLV
ncbi:MAG: ABC transporter ATP-binding protein [Armatimonadota bacterium]|nr:ABC transporter ATP-binding protein [Armatimonadota bacterium]